MRTEKLVDKGGIFNNFVDKLNEMKLKMKHFLEFRIS